MLDGCHVHLMFSILSITLRDGCT